MYARALVVYADLERMTDDKPAAIALMQQAKEVLDANGPPAARGTLCYLQFSGPMFAEKINLRYIRRVLISNCCFYGLRI